MSVISLKRADLAPFIGSSYATQRRISNKTDKELIRFGKSEHDRLATQMPPKAITLAEDETFNMDYPPRPRNRLAMAA
jgi:hypothetical protein